MPLIIDTLTVETVAIVPTVPQGDNSTNAATTAYVDTTTADLDFMLIMNFRNFYNY